jgi:acetoin utilization deacetylase AcuC-like enzyme
MTTLYITHPACLNHLTPPGHPERPDRLRAVEAALAEPEFEPLVRIQAPMASLETITLCHPMEYVEHIREAVPEQGMVRLDSDTAVSRQRSARSAAPCRPSTR